MLLSSIADIRGKLIARIIFSIMQVSIMVALCKDFSEDWYTLIEHSALLNYIGIIITLIE